MTKCILFLVILLILTGCKSSRPMIAVIPRTCGTPLWESEHAGVAAVARTSGVDIYWNAPMQEDDIQTQISLVESVPKRGFAGLIISPIKTLPIRQTCDPSEPNSPSGMIAGTRRVTVMTGDDGRRAILRLPGLGIISSALVRSPHHLHGVLDVAPLIGLLGFALAFASLRILSRLRDRREAVPLEHLPRDHVNLHFRYHVALPMLCCSRRRGDR